MTGEKAHEVDVLCLLKIKADLVPENVFILNLEMCWDLTLAHPLRKTTAKGFLLRKDSTRESLQYTNLNLHLDQLEKPGKHLYNIELLSPDIEKSKSVPSSNFTTKKVQESLKVV